MAPPSTRSPALSLHSWMIRTMSLYSLTALCIPVPHYLSNMREIVKVGAKIFFSCLFLYYSMTSLKSWVDGEVSYSLILRRQTKLVFPSVTLCPSQDKNPLMNIKIGQLKADYKLNDSEIESFNILPTFLNPRFNLSHILDKYSYSRQESLSYDGQFM